MELIKVTTGLFWIEIPEKNFYLMCGCPMDSIKHLTNKKIITVIENSDSYKETGPNAILLSDLPVQNGYFCNLAEFPILHMMYKQGRSFSDSSEKPWIIGTEEQVSAQKHYIFRGNYGLASPEEILQAGCLSDHVDQMWQLKMQFNNNILLEPEELINTTVMGTSPVELKPGIILERKGLNLYELTCGNESVSIDLNLQIEELYEPPYQLEFHKISREYFSVIHMGEGNGWDNTRPCMGSVITYQGKIYLIDAGPNIEYSLNALGISVNDVDGLFHTHIHDDHFAGLTYLVMADHKIKYFAVPSVTETARKKLSALMGQDETIFDTVFDVVPLDCGQWNDQEGLEIQPIFSPHPVETTIFYFRVKKEDVYKSYAHLADIVSTEVLKSFISKDPEKGISKELYQDIWKGYLEKADIKKIDVGGGFVHGNADDFKDDPSDLILLSHKDGPLTEKEKKIGESASFGTQHILIPAEQDYRKEHLYTILKDYFPSVSDRDLKELLNYENVNFNTGETLAKQGEFLDSVYVILFGKVNYVHGNKKTYSEMTSGSMIGITNSIWGKHTVGSYLASSYVETLKIPIDTMIAFLDKNNLLDNLRDTIKIVRNLRQSFLLGSRISSRKLVKLAQRAGIIHLLPGDVLPKGWSKDLYLINEGTLEVLHDGKSQGKLVKGSTWGGYPLSPIWKELNVTAHVSKDGPVELYRFSYEVIKEIPVVQWKLFQMWSCWAATC